MALVADSRVAVVRHELALTDRAPLLAATALCVAHQQAREQDEAERTGTAAALLARAKAQAVAQGDAFKSAAAAEVFGSLAGGAAGGMSLDARISSRRHYHQR
jgi:hypothetical protein